MSFLTGGSGMKRDPHGVGVGGHRKLDCVATFSEILQSAGRSGWRSIRDEGVWTIPTMRTKASREHRVPLCRRALEILVEARELGNGSPLVFPSMYGRPLRSMALPGLLRDLKIAAVPHGFRSSFREWAAEETNHPREVTEAALAHKVRNQVEAAYRRTDLFEHRRQLMNDWAAYVAGGSQQPRGVVSTLCSS